LQRNYTGCAICDSTWGDLHADIDGERMFFCCAICVVQFRALLARIKAETGWPRLDSLEISGGRRGRRCAATHGPDRLDFDIVFGPDGDVLTFTRR
jgi:Ta0938